MMPPNTTVVIPEGEAIGFGTFGDAMIRVVVGKDDEKKEFLVYQSLLTLRSQFFRNAMRSTTPTAQRPTPGIETMATSMTATEATSTAMENTTNQTPKRPRMSDEKRHGDFAVPKDSIHPISPSDLACVSSPTKDGGINASEKNKGGVKEAPKEAATIQSIKRPRISGDEKRSWEDYSYPQGAVFRPSSQHWARGTPSTGAPKPPAIASFHPVNFTSDINPSLSLYRQPATNGEICQLPNGKVLPSASQDMVIKPFERTVELPRENPQMFALYLELCFSGKIPLRPVGMDNESLMVITYRRLLELYLLCKRIQDDRACRSISSATFQEMEKGTFPHDSPFPEPKDIKLLYEGTNTCCAMRKILVQMWYERIGNPDKWSGTNSETFNKEFLFDLCKTSSK